MTKIKKRPRGRPPGPVEGGYKPPHLRRATVPVRLPQWMKDRLDRRLEARHESYSSYVEKLVMNDTGWVEPKKVS